MAANAKPVRKSAEPEPATAQLVSSSCDIAAMDRLIHERTRLAIVSALAANTVLTFSELKGILAVSDGNLSTHCRKLEDAAYIICTKSFDGRQPRTQYRLSSTGKQALQQYLGHMEALIAAMKPA